MGFILFLLFICLFGGWAIGKILGTLLFPKNDDGFNFKSSKEKESPTIINNYKTEQHLHISKEDLKDLLGNNKS